MEHSIGYDREEVRQVRRRMEHSTGYDRDFHLGPLFSERVNSRDTPHHWSGSSETLSIIAVGLRCRPSRGMVQAAVVARRSSCGPQERRAILHIGRQLLICA
jgi:hypothetical protein